jgi:hypothetical protein
LLEVYQELALTFDNKCHSLSRANCYLDEEKNKKLFMKFSYLQNKHLFNDSVSCAKKVFGYEEGILNITFLE